MSIEHSTDLTNEFHRIADQPAPPYLVDLGQIVTTGQRAKRRRRAVQATLTTTTAAVVLCGVAAVANYSAQPAHVPSAAGSASVVSTPTDSPASSSATGTFTVAVYVFPMSVSGSTETMVVTTLSGLGFTSVTTRSMNSSTVASGNVIGIVDAQDRSVLGKTVAADTPLTLLVSTGPTR